MMFTLDTFWSIVAFIGGLLLVLAAINSAVQTFVVPRSSTPKKKGLSIPHGIGIIDQDYCGPDDEIMIQFYNFTNQPVFIERGERIGQATFVKISKTEWMETDEFLKKSRGGFGSTGKNI